jgi:O-antigen ligase
MWGYMIKLFTQLQPETLLFGVIFAGVVFVRPYFGLLVMMIMIPLEAMLVFSTGVTAIKIAGLITFVAFMCHVLLGIEKIEINPVICIFLILFVLWTALTMEGNFSRLVLLVQLLGLSVMTISLCHKSDRRLILACFAFIAGSLIAACLAASGYLSSGSYARAALEGQDANKYASIIGMAIIISLYLKNRFAGFKRRILYGMVVFFLYSLIISASRGAIVALCLSYFIYLAGNKKKLKAAANIVVIVLLISTIVMIGYKKGLIRGFTLNRIVEMQSLENTRTLVGRVAIWRIVWEIAKDNFITGVGLGNLPSVFAKYTGAFGPDGVSRGTGWETHNVYLSILVETGGVGLVLFLWFLGYLSFFIWKSENEDKIFALYLLAFIGIFSLTVTNHLTKAYWVGIALSYLISNCKSQHLLMEDSSEPDGEENETSILQTSR